MGIGIGFHIDTHSAFGPALASISLGSGCSMDLRYMDEENAAPDGLAKECSVYLPQRSAIILSGISRYAVAHRIPFRKVE